ncbi:LptF/LptG family permease [candidate division KSB1 bacterium]|nr:LptF/LptG family permease [candidate division KSB1 bacterium]
MLRITDRYFLKRFLALLGFAITAFLVIFVIVDIVEKMDTFIDREASVENVLWFYLYSIPNFLLLILPIAMLMASLFAMGQLVKDGELTALKAAGVSLYRVIFPVAVLATLISVFAFWFGEWVASSSERQKSEIYNNKIKKYQNIMITKDNIILQDTRTRQVSIGHYDGFNHVGTMINIMIQNGNSIDTTISARQLIPDGNDWTLIDGKIRDFTTGVEVVQEFDEYDVLDFNFIEDDLIAVKIKPEERNVVELQEFIEKLQQLGVPHDRWKVDYYGKFAFPFANLVVVMLGLPLATRDWRGGNAFGFGISVFICFVYYVIMTFSNSLGYKGVLSPITAAWFSNFLFGVIGIGALITAKK